RERRRRLDNAGDRGRFRERHVAHVFAEEEARGLRDAEDRERTALSERDVVQVHLQDLVFRRPRGEDHRHENLEHLPPDRSLARAGSGCWRRGLGRENLPGLGRRGRGGPPPARARPRGEKKGGPPAMPTGPPPGFSKNRRSSIERTASTIRAGMALSATGRRFS